MTITTIQLPADFGNDGLRDAEIMRSAFEYRDGKLFWKIRPSRNILAGREAGTLRGDGYRTLTVGNTAHRAHRLIWLVCNSSWPTGYIDHINGDQRNNRIENLRDVSASINGRNKSKFCNNTSGHTGVYWSERDKRWQASIHVNGKGLHLGLFKTKEPAVAARKQAEILHGYHENHGRD